jgi:hypothetical protein
VCSFQLLQDTEAVYQEATFCCAYTDSVDCCPKAEPWEQICLTLYTLASRLQKQKAKLSPQMAACDFIGYFIPPVLCDLLHVSVLQVLSLCFAIPSSCLTIRRTQPVCFSFGPPPCYKVTKFVGAPQLKSHTGGRCYPCRGKTFYWGSSWPLVSEFSVLTE